MKKTSLIIFSLFLMSVSVYAQAMIQGAKKDAKILVAYFSRADENYGVGNIKTGNTEVLANFIAEYLKGELFHIETEKAYPKSYKECTDVAKKEQTSKARPKLKEEIKNLKDYDIVFLGYPNWWGDMPMAVYTFLENNDFSGKVIIPFCTHEGSGASNTVRNIEKTCPKAKVLKAFAMRGTVAQKERDRAKRDVIDWIKKIEIKN
ncbi:MAG: flavodoxin [Treponema sp.]